MTAGRMGLGPINVTRLEHPLESGNPVLFVELRTLRQVRRPLEIFDLEKIGATLGSARHDLGGNDLSEPLSAQIGPEPFQNGRLDPEDFLNRTGSDAERPVIQEN